jgi:hypothetical protein
MIVRAKANIRYNDYLTPGKDYVVIGLDEESFRVIDDKGEPVPFPRLLFNILDGAIPSDWIWEEVCDTEFQAEPSELHSPGFYDDFFAGKQSAVKKLDSYLSRIGVSRTYSAGALQKIRRKQRLSVSERRSGLTAGTRVRVMPHPFWPHGTVGTIRAFPSYAAELCADSEGCCRVVDGAERPLVFYWVVFDQPTNDGDGDGPYGEGEVMKEYLVVLGDKQGQASFQGQ